MSGSPTTVKARPPHTEIEKIEHRSLAVAGYNIETQLRAHIEKWARSNLEHRRWLITQLSDTKLKDPYPGYKLR